MDASEIGPNMLVAILALFTLISAAISGTISSVPAFLGYLQNKKDNRLAAIKTDEVAKKTEEVRTTLQEATKSTDGKLDSIYKEVNHTAKTLAEEKKETANKHEAETKAIVEKHKAELDVLNAQILALTKELSELKGAEKQAAIQPQSQPHPLAPAVSDKVQEIEIKVTGMEVQDMTVHKMTESEKREKDEGK